MKLFSIISTGLLFSLSLLRAEVSVGVSVELGSEPDYEYSSRDSYAVLYDEPLYQGRYIVLSEDYSAVDLSELEVGFVVRSVRVVGNMQVILYDQPEYWGHRLAIYSSVPNFAHVWMYDNYGNRFRWNERAFSICLNWDIPVVHSTVHWSYDRPLSCVYFSVSQRPVYHRPPPLIRYPRGMIPGPPPPPRRAVGMRSPPPPYSSVPPRPRPPVMAPPPYSPRPVIGAPPGVGRPPQGVPSRPPVSAPPGVVRPPQGIPPRPSVSAPPRPVMAPPTARPPAAVPPASRPVIVRPAPPTSRPGQVNPQPPPSSRPVNPPTTSRPGAKPPSAPPSSPPTGRPGAEPPAPPTVAPGNHPVTPPSAPTPSGKAPQRRAPSSRNQPPR